MLTAIKLILALVISYLIGSLPTAYIFARVFKGVDIRQHGSGNVGATNAIRVLGKPLGIPVLIIDILKGTVATAFVGDVFGLGADFFRVILGIAAVVGHNWTIFLNFKGGRGVATSIGVLLGLAIKISSLRAVFILTIATWILTLLISGFVSLSSMLAAFLVPIFMLIFDQPIEFVSLGIIFCFFIIWRHRPNIKRLLFGNESQINTCLLKRKRFPQ